MRSQGNGIQVLVFFIPVEFTIFLIDLVDGLDKQEAIVILGWLPGGLLANFDLAAGLLKVEDRASAVLAAGADQLIVQPVVEALPLLPTPELSVPVDGLAKEVLCQAAK